MSKNILGLILAVLLLVVAFIFLFLIRPERNVVIYGDGGIGVIEIDRLSGEIRVRNLIKPMIKSYREDSWVEVR